MIFSRKNKLFWVNLTLTGALIFGAPVFVQGAADHSGEGQIHKPAYDITTGPGTEGFIDDSTDNTYGYYTIMGTTTVTLEEMTDLYETQGAEYPRSLKEGGAETIEDFCSIILEEAEEEGVRAEVVYVQAMLETGWLQFGGDAVESQFNFPVSEQREEAFRETLIRMFAPVSALRYSI